MGTGSGGLLNEPVSRLIAAMTADAVDRLAEWAAARVRRVLLQHQLWIDSR